MLALAWVVALTCASLLGLMPRRRDGGRGSGLGLVWLGYLAVVAPALGLLVPHGVVHKGGDRYAYLPSCVLLVGIAPWLYSQLRAPWGGPGDCRRSWGRSVVSAGLILVTTATVSALVWGLGKACQVQVVTWRSEEAVYRKALTFDPKDWRVADMYSDLLYRAPGRRQEAWALMGIAADNAPTYTVKGQLLRIKHLHLLGEGPAVCEAVFEGVRRFPQHPYILNNRALCLTVGGSEEARRSSLEAMEKALALATQAGVRDDFMRYMDSNWSLLREWSGREGEVEGLALLY
ncbi:unnamed protein product [Discosporangium mesarthrocarpum]